MEDIEKALNLYGIHTYLYAPQVNEDVSTVVKHLHSSKTFTQSGYCCIVIAG